MNTFMNNLAVNDSLKKTENGAVAYSSTLSGVYDLFALGGSYRNRSINECIELFRSAYVENPTYAIKCLFYLRDVIGGQGERRFFRICYEWLINNDIEMARRNLRSIPNFGRWDDLIYICEGSLLEETGFEIVHEQLAKDMGTCESGKNGISLCAKWVPSENASSAETKRVAGKLREFLGISHKSYRKILSRLRSTINIVEKLMSQNRWEEIEFDKIPSRAGLIYRNAFARREILQQKYKAFLEDDSKKMNSATLYPYEIVNQVLKNERFTMFSNLKNDEVDVTERKALNKAWENLPDYFEGREESMIAVVDTSGSMTYGQPMPLSVAISLGIYCGEKNSGDFANKFITFSSRPKMVTIEGNDIVEKVISIADKSIIDDTNLEKVFDLLFCTAQQSNFKDIPKTVIVISDMEINQAESNIDYGRDPSYQVKSLMRNIRETWEASGVPMPRLVYWNVNARNDTILDVGENVSLVSGCSPIIFQMVMGGKTGWDLCLEKILSERYKEIY